jgi:hypothetical protein
VKLRPLAGLAAGLALLALPASAGAAPVTVQLRIEGPRHTLFESPVTTDVRQFHFSGDATMHTCDGTPPAGSATTPEITRGAVVTAAEDSAGLVADGTWSAMFGSPCFTEINGENVDFDPGTGDFLVEYLNEHESSTGSCGEQVHTGDRVLYAYGDGSQQLLALSGPAAAATGSTVTLRVTDAQTHSPVAGANVDGRLSAADGTLTIGPLTAGTHVEKATKANAIRSNAVRIAVSASPPPPTVTPPDHRAPLARLLGLRDHQRFRRARAPRTLRIAVPSDPSGVAKLQLRLTRQLGRRWWYFSGARGRFVRARPGRRVPFSVPVQSRVSYLLPRRLRRGRYVLDVIATDGAGNREALARGTSRVVFFVR